MQYPASRWLHCLSRAALAGGALFSSVRFQAQVAASTVQASPVEAETYELSPFVVTSEKDSGYVATNTLAGSRLNTKLIDTPAAISVMTKDFISDIGATSLNQAIEYATGAGNDVTDIVGNNLLRNQFNFQIRGYRGTTVTRDYFVTVLSSDAFNIDRVEVARGPNSLLFGIGGPGGIVNTTPKRAILENDFSEVTVRAGSWNEQRGSLDVNQSLLNDKLAVRVNLMTQRADGFKDFERDDQDRGALAVTYRPFNQTTIRLDSEFGRLDQSRARKWSAIDGISNWIKQGSHYFDYGTPQNAADENYTQAHVPNDRGPLFPNAGGFERRSFPLATPTLYMTDGPLAGKLLNTGTSPQGARYYRKSDNGNNPAGFDSPIYVEDENLYPRRGNISGPGNKVINDYQTYGFDIEQRVGRNLTLDLVFNQTVIDNRTQNTTVYTNNIYQIDVMSTLPTFATSGAYNATMGGAVNNTSSITTSGGFVATTQGNSALNFAQGGLINNPYVGWGVAFYTPSYSVGHTRFDDWRASASYKLELGRWGDHNLLGFYTENFNKFVGETRTEGNVADNRPAALYADTRNYGGRVAHYNPWSSKLEERGVADPFTRPLPDSQLFGGDLTKGFKQGWYRTARPKSLSETRSWALATVSSFFEKSLIITAGVRGDKVESESWSFLADPVTGEAGAILNEISTTEAEDQTYSAGFAYKLPKLKGVSVFANKSTNFRPQTGAVRFEDELIRVNLPVGPLTGTGKDAGLKFQLLDERINATLGYFEVDQSNASTGYSGNYRPWINAIWTTILNNGDPAGTLKDSTHPTGHRADGSETRKQVSEGYEFELTANLTRNWRLSLNLTKADNEVSDLGNNIQAYMDKHMAEWETWRATPYTPDPAVGNVGKANTVGDLIDGLNLLQGFTKAGEGLPEINARAVNGNLFTAYRVSEGILKGLTVGMGVNYRGNQVLAIKPAVAGKLATATTPEVPVTPAVVYKGGAYYLYNGMLAYEFKLRDAKAVLQFNVDNLLNNQDKQTLQSAFDSSGNLHTFHYQFDPRSYSLSLKLSF